MAYGIDVSHWQGTIDWNKVKADGKEFAILKAGGSDTGFYTDSMFEINYKKAKAAGVHVGAYYFVGPGFKTKADGAADAKRFLEIIKGKQFEYPVYVDVEATSPSDRAGATMATIAFCGALENAGYYAGIYASDISGFKDRLDLDSLIAYDKWVARYSGKPTYVQLYGMFQYSSTGNVSGINGYVDMNESYKDYPKIIKSAGLNGFNSSTSTTAKTETTATASSKQSIDAVAQDIVKGVYGNDPARRTNLKNKGYTDAEITSIYAKVNELMKSKNTASYVNTNVKLDAAKGFNNKFSGKYSVSNGSGVRMRAGAGTSKDIICIVPYKAKVQCYGYYSLYGTTTWLYVTYNGQEGFISSDYLAKN